MIHTIGETAGKIYQALETNGPLSLGKLKTLIKADTFSLHAAIGWLARENKISLEKKGRSTVVALL